MYLQRFLAFSGVGGGGESVPSKVLTWWKSEQNMWKFG